MSPTYVFATLPGETKPEFLLMTHIHAAYQGEPDRRDAGALRRRHLGEIVVLQLSKQELILGPMQINARINQDQNISKDLTLWNQQGSQVLQGQTLVLPVGDTFLYVSPLYLQATQARMPQLKKVVLAVGNRLIYADTYEQALAMLGGSQPAQPRLPPLPNRRHREAFLGSPDRERPSASAALQRVGEPGQVVRRGARTGRDSDRSG